MANILTLIYDRVREDLGTPVKLLHFLSEHREIRVNIQEPARVIAAHSIVAWHEWGTRVPLEVMCHRGAGWIKGWRYAAGSYGSFDLHCQELASLGRCDIADKWTCDIRDVSGFSSSKSDLVKFGSMDEMVERNSPEMIDDLSEEKLRQNLAHREIRILHNENTSDHFAQYRWDGRVFLMNSGGSHHFAAARYIAIRIGRHVPLEGKLYTYSIDEKAVETLCGAYEMFAISAEPTIVNGFRDAMESFKATYLWRYLPRPYDSMKAILLPKDEPRSMRASAAMRQAGVFDLGRHLTTLCATQAE